MFAALRVASSAGYWIFFAHDFSWAVADGVGNDWRRRVAGGVWDRGTGF